MGEKVKTNGAEFKRFYMDPEFWPDGVWHDDTFIVVDGSDDQDIDLEKIADTAVVEFDCGYVMGPKDEDLGSFVHYFHKWKKKQTTAVLTVEVPIGRERELAEFAKSIGGKVK